MSAPQLALEWMENPDTPSRGVCPGVIAWCGCGWRAGYPSRGRQETAEATEAVEAAYDAHRRAAHPYPDEVEERS